jgi:hypothetical protein
MLEAHPHPTPLPEGEGDDAVARWWLIALTTAFSEADEMLLSMPTPQRTARCPSVSST